MSYTSHFNSRSRKVMLRLSKFLPKCQTTQELRKPDGVWKELEESLREQFPNPKRQGCPSPKILESIGSGKLTLSEAEQWLDHLGHCSPCFRDFDAFRVRRPRYHRLKWGTAAAAMVLLCSGFAIRFLHIRNPSVLTGSPPASASASPQTSISQPQLVTLHLEPPSLTRGGTSDSKLQRLPRVKLLISIYMPQGSAPGNYELQFLVNPADSQPLASVQGAAKIVNGQTVLSVATDLSHFEPGEYVLAFRRVGAGWVYSSVDIS
jgi:hypothetical protein